MPITTFVNGINPFQSPSCLAYAAAGHPSSRYADSSTHYAYASVDQHQVSHYLVKHGTRTCREVADGLGAEMTNVSNCLMGMLSTGSASRARDYTCGKACWYYTCESVAPASLEWPRRVRDLLRNRSCMSAEQIAYSLDAAHPLRDKLSRMEKDGVLASLQKIPAGGQRSVKHYYLAAT